MNMWNSLGTAGGSIEIVPYSAEWPERFALEARRILVACTGIITAIEHIGSTAIPGMPAKPILRRHLIFRDDLRNNPAIATQYAELKKELAIRFRNDREAYTNGKSEFINSVVRKAQEKNA